MVSTRQALIIGSILVVANLAAGDSEVKKVRVSAIDVRKLATNIVNRERTFGIDSGSTTPFLLVYEGFQRPRFSVIDAEASRQRYQEALRQAGPNAHVNVDGVMQPVRLEYATTTPLMADSLSDYLAQVRSAAPSLDIDVQEHKGGIIRDRILADAGDKWVLNRKLAPEEYLPQSIESAITLLNTKYGMSPTAMTFINDRESTVSLPQHGTATVRDLMFAILKKNGETHALPHLLQVLPLNTGVGMSTAEDYVNPSVLPEIHGWTILGILDSKQRIREVRSRKD
jgi:hypothetical protein